MSSQEPIYLIVNADDYAYYPCISRGILEAASSGAITATGILPNRPDLQEQLVWLDSVKCLDLGVHLNLSWGRPLSTDIAKKLAKFSGNFPGVYTMNRMLMSGQISLADVREEWRAQIEVCQSERRKLFFLNSHEHIHMLPRLFSLVIELAEEFRIPHIRLTRAEWSVSSGITAFTRNAVIQVMYSLNSFRHNIHAPVFLGLGQSGKLKFCYLEKIFSILKPGKTYELMCHPGRFNPDEIPDNKLRAYHDWESELSLLQSPELQALYERYGIRLSYYRNYNK